MKTVFTSLHEIIRIRYEQTNYFIGGKHNKTFFKDFRVREMICVPAEKNSAVEFRQSSVSEDEEFKDAK